MITQIDIETPEKTKLMDVSTNYTLVKKKEHTYYEVKHKLYFVIKRIFDIICSIIGIIALIPIAFVTKICYLLTGDTKSIFYTQKRIGKNGKEFDFYKIRSMVPNADKMLNDILSNNDQMAEEYKINKKLKNDPRITKIGNFLRKTSLDEFPQFINVLKGEMSIIGNRPYLPIEKIDMGTYFDDIVKTKCGIVSYWAVSGRSDVNFKTRLELEKYYSNNQSIKLDVMIFLKVFKIVLFRKGAN